MVNRLLNARARLSIMMLRAGVSTPFGLLVSAAKARRAEAQDRKSRYARI